MTVKEIKAMFEDDESDEFLAFARIPAEKRKNNRPDIHAFLLLDELAPGTEDIVTCAEHDEIWLAVEIKQLTKATPEQIVDLMRCGVRWDTSTDSLAMFV